MNNTKPVLSLIASILRSALCIAASLVFFIPGEAVSQARHRILIGGCGLGYVGIVDANGNFEWKHTEPAEVSDAWLLPDGNVIYSYISGVKIVKPNYANPALDQVVWDRKAAAGSENNSCQPIENGRFLIGESRDNSAALIEVDTTNHEYLRITIPTVGGAHFTLRQVRKTPQGTYLVPLYAGVAAEYSNTGTKIRSFPDGKYSALRLADGHTLLGGGNDHSTMEVDSSGAITWQVGQNDIAGITFGFVAGIVRQPNGNTIICNWGGHGDASGSAVVEITPDKKIAWSTPSTIPNNVSTVQILADSTPTGTKNKVTGMKRSSAKNGTMGKGVYLMNGAMIRVGNSKTRSVVVPLTATAIF